MLYDDGGYARNKRAYFKCPGIAAMVIRELIRLRKVNVRSTTMDDYGGYKVEWSETF